MSRRVKSFSKEVLMGLGVMDTSVGVSEWPVPANDGKGVQVHVSIPQSYHGSQGQMDFLKRGAGGEIYIGLAGKKASPTNYDIVLSDAIPAYNVDGVVVGDVYVVGSNGITGVNLSSAIFICAKAS
jgi:hypothetical protein